MARDGYLILDSDLHMMEPGDLWARYLDRFEQRDGVWLIARRRLLVDWMYKYPAQGWFDDHPDASVGLRDGTDPSLRPVAGFAGTPQTTEEWPA